MAEPRQVYFEIRRLGSAVKVSAIDGATATEVSIVGDPRTSEAVLKRTALRKLEYVLSKQGGK